MTKKPIIAEQTVDYIRANQQDLALRFPGLFLIFRGKKILKKFKRNDEARNYVMTHKLEGVIIWGFDPLPIRTGLRLMADKEEMKKKRARELARLRQKRYYDKNRDKINAKRARKRKENPEQSRGWVRTWYYKDPKAAIAKKKAQAMARVCTKKNCTV